MRFDVLVQVVLTREPPHANIAGEQLVLRVDQQMSLEVRVQPELFAAEAAHERPLTGVNAHMEHQLCLVVARPVTLAADVQLRRLLPVVAQVCSHLRSDGEVLCADVAHVPPGLVWMCGTDVAAEVFGAAVPFRAGGAEVLLQLEVLLHVPVVDGDVGKRFRAFSAHEPRRL